MSRLPLGKSTLSSKASKLTSRLQQRERLAVGKAKAIAIEEFDDDYQPRGPLVQLESQPVVLRFSPSSYRSVEPKELKEWHAEVSDRLGSSFDIGPGFGGPISFCERGGSGAAYRCDSDIEATDRAGAVEQGGRLKPWSTKPVVLDFPPVAYELVEPSALKDWAVDLQKRFGLDFDIGPGGGGGTISFCTRGGSGAAYRCDSDIS